MSRRCFGLLSLWLAMTLTACATSVPAKRGSGVAGEGARPRGRWVIASGAVGDVEVGKPLPKALLGEDLEKRYVARYVADNLPFDGFRYDDPPITVEISDGPFASGQDETALVAHDLNALVDRFRVDAAKLARGGATVKSISVRAPGPATESGHGVGSTVRALRGAYPDLKLTALPEPVHCVATTSELRGVYFVFNSCAAAEKGEPARQVQLGEGAY